MSNSAYSNSWEPLGDAMMDYHRGDTSATILVLSDLEDPLEEPVSTFFRDPDDFPALEIAALNICTGRVLDIGAGSGCHALALQEMGLDVVAIDIIPEAVEIMIDRGVRDARCTDVYNLRVTEGDLFDTLLMMMNGIGIVGTIKGLQRFLGHAKKLIKPDGSLILDSNDLRGVVTPEEIAARLAIGPRTYFGEVRYQMRYRDRMGPAYWWLYLDPDMLTEMAEKTDWLVEAIYQRDEGHYLAKLVLNH